MRGVLNYAGCFAEAVESIDRVSGWEAGLRDGLDYVHNLCSLWQSWSEQEPYQAVIQPESVF